MRSPSKFDWTWRTRETGLRRELAESFHVLVQCRRAVDLGISRTQQVEVRSRQQQDLVAHVSPRNLSNTSLHQCRVDAAHGLESFGAPQHEGQVVVGLLVVAHRLEERRRRKVPRESVDWSPKKSSTSSCRTTSLGSTRPSATASRAREGESDGDGFAVTQALRVSRASATLLEAWAERVAVVQERASSALALVVADDRGLQLSPTSRSSRGTRPSVSSAAKPPSRSQHFATSPSPADVRAPAT